MDYFVGNRSIEGWGCADGHQAWLGICSMFPSSASVGATEAREAASGAGQRGLSSKINFIFFPQSSHSKMHISPFNPAGNGECQTARAFSPHREQAIGLIWDSAINLDATRRGGMTLLPSTPTGTPIILPLYFVD